MQVGARLAGCALQALLGRLDLAGQLQGAGGVTSGLDVVWPVELQAKTAQHQSDGQASQPIDGYQPRATNL